MAAPRLPLLAGTVRFPLTQDERTLRRSVEALSGQWGAQVETMRGRELQPTRLVHRQADELLR